MCGAHRFLARNLDKVQKSRSVFTLLSLQPPGKQLPGAGKAGLDPVGGFLTQREDHRRPFNRNNALNVGDMIYNHKPKCSTFKPLTLTCNIQERERLNEGARQEKPIRQSHLTGMTQFFNIPKARMGLG